MTPIDRRLFLALSSVFVPSAFASSIPSAAFAHHGWSGYDTSKSFEVTGEIMK